MLYDRVSSPGYEECQDDILAASRMAEDIRDVLLEYQVGSSRAEAVIITEVELFNRQSSNRQYMTRVAD